MAIQNQSINEPNRILQALYEYEAQEARFRVSQPLDRNDDLVTKRLKYDFYQSLLNANKKDRTAREKITIGYVKGQLRKLRELLRPTNLIIAAFLFPFKIVAFVADFITARTSVYLTYKRELKNIAQRVAKTQNLDNLQANLKKAGFIQNLEGPLKDKLDLNVPKFHLRYVHPDNPKADFVLHFTKIHNSNGYQFEEFTATHRPNLESVLRNDKNDLSKTFSLSDEVKINASEAAKLVSGRPIYKVIDGKENWMSLVGATIQNGTHKIRTVPFELEKELGKWPIKELSTAGQYDKLLRSLKNSGEHQVTLKLPTGPEKMTISVSPFADKLNFKDTKGKLLDMSSLTGQYQQQKVKAIIQRSQHPASKKGLRVT